MRAPVREAGQRRGREEPYCCGFEGVDKGDGGGEVGAPVDEADAEGERGVVRGQGVRGEESGGVLEVRVQVGHVGAGADEAYAACGC